MQGGSGFFPPVQYSPVWLVIGVVILAVIVGWYVFVLLLTRRRPEPVDLVATAPGLTVSMRDAYLNRINEVSWRYSHGSLGFSDAHHELSALVRGFAAEARGIRAQYMTLDDLRSTPHADLAATVEALYPGAFSGGTTGSIDDATARARTLVSTWN